MALALQVALALLVALQAGASTLPEEAGILREGASIQEEASIPVAATTPTMWFTTTMKLTSWLQPSILAELASRWCPNMAPRHPPQNVAHMPSHSYQSYQSNDSRRFMIFGLTIHDLQDPQTRSDKHGPIISGAASVKAVAVSCSHLGHISVSKRA